MTKTNKVLKGNDILNRIRKEGKKVKLNSLPIRTKTVLNGIIYDKNVFISKYGGMLGHILYKNRYTEFIRTNNQFFSNNLDDFINELNCICIEILNKYPELNNLSYVSTKGETLTYFSFLYRTVLRQFINFINNNYFKKAKLNNIVKSYYQNENFINIKNRQLEFTTYQKQLNEIIINHKILDDHFTSEIEDKDLLEDIISKLSQTLTPKRVVILKALLNKVNINKALKHNGYANANIKEIEKVKIELLAYFNQLEDEILQPIKYKYNYIDNIISKPAEYKKCNIYHIIKDNKVYTSYSSELIYNQI